MHTSSMRPARQTSADLVFERIYSDIVSLGLMPGDKLSEAEIAERFGISRQPVRDAFNRLGNLGLLRIQPQRATQVQKFSLKAIELARFERRALELEVGRLAISKWTPALEERFETNLAAQRKAETSGDPAQFHGLDEAFHALISEMAGMPEVFDSILEKKVQVDRICVLSLKDKKGMQVLVDDHVAIHASLKARDTDAFEQAMRTHLSRIDTTIQKVHAEHADYFE